jgi:simple sugar transport system ATP-binding protein
VEQKQIVEIARALSTGARFLILDEPTASLESSAIERLFRRVRRMKENGVAILYISHHLEEIFEICDTVTVLRDGKRIVTAPVAELDHERLVSSMVGSALARSQDTFASSDGDGVVRLEVSGLSARSPLGDAHEISLTVRAGECLGLFGLRGSGAVAIADAVAGLLKPVAGSILINGAPLHSGKVDSALAHGVAYIPEDRHARGYVPTLGVRENLTLPILDRLSPFLGVLRASTTRSAAAPIAQRLQIVSSGLEQPVAELSGGNQQKVVVGRAFASAPSLLVVVSPTVGVDVASKEALLGVIDEARRDGTAVLLVSDDLDELRLCTRLLVVRRGAVVREFRPPWERQTLIAVAEGFGAAA